MLSHQREGRRAVKQQPSRRYPCAHSISFTLRRLSRRRDGSGVRSMLMSIGEWAVHMEMGRRDTTVNAAVPSPTPLDREASCAGENKKGREKKKNMCLCFAPLTMHEKESSMMHEDGRTGLIETGRIVVEARGRDARRRRARFGSARGSPGRRGHSRHCGHGTPTDPRRTRRTGPGACRARRAPMAPLRNTRSKRA